MLYNWRTIYDKMLSEISLSHTGGLSEREATRNAFEVAATYWELVRFQFEKAAAGNPAGEIEFYLYTRPSFRAYTEFLKTKYNAILMKPPNVFSEYLYWEKQQEDIQEFFEINAAKRLYFKTPFDPADARFFINNRRLFDKTLTIAPIMKNGRIFESFDELKAFFLSRELFLGYISGKLKEFSQ